MLKIPHWNVILQSLEEEAAILYAGPKIPERPPMVFVPDCVLEALDDDDSPLAEMIADTESGKVWLLNDDTVGLCSPKTIIIYPYEDGTQRIIATADDEQKTFIRSIERIQSQIVSDEHVLEWFRNNNRLCGVRNYKRSTEVEFVDEYARASFRMRFGL